jgi:acetyltransferase
VALIDANAKPSSASALVLRNLRRSRFSGELMVVSSGQQAIDEQPVHPDVASLPHGPDLAVLDTAPETAPSLIAELGDRGTRAAVVVARGFGELGEQALTLQRQGAD